MNIILSMLLAATIMDAPQVPEGKAAKCAHFNTQEQAQTYFTERKRGWKRLDGDKDGEACECLHGGSSYSDNRCIRWRKKNGKP